jgi:hypothetical protein
MAKKHYTTAMVSVIGIVSLVLLGGCAPDKSDATALLAAKEFTPEPEVIQEPEAVRIPPAWTQSPSPSAVDTCKVPNARPITSGNSQQAQAVGFPVSLGTLPTQGSANIIAAMVAFDDAPAPDLTAEGFFAPQLEKITQWSDFWSQNTFRYEFQMVEDWVIVPIDHADYPINSNENYELSRANSAAVIQKVIDSLPPELDYENADGFLVYWAPGIDEFHSDVAVRGNEGVTLSTPDGSRQMFFWSGNNFHYADTGQMTAELKRDYTWSLWVYFMLLSQGLMLHAPGNGWATGLGQAQIPNPDFSGAIPVWDAFRLGWISDDQVHCVSANDVSDDMVKVMLTPQEVYGGERKTIILPLNAKNDVVVIESRRPTGYSLWPKSESGLLVYTVNPSVGNLDMMSRESQGSCGNQDNYSKWAYYLYPDSFDMTQVDCNDFRAAFVREGDSLTYGGVTITLEFSGDDLDFVSITSVEDGG